MVNQRWLTDLSSVVVASPSVKWQLRFLIQWTLKENVDHHKSTERQAELHCRNGEVYELNFIDTPGHVDFSYEVSRSLYACEGALLVVDAAQGVEAQSVANCYTAIEQGLEVVPVLNKMDLPQAEPERVKEEIENIIGLDASDAIPCSAKSGLGIDDLLEQLIKKIPPPSVDRTLPTRALIIDSWFDSYLGVVSLVRVMQGALRKGQKIRVKSTGRDWQGRCWRLHAETVVQREPTRWSSRVYDRGY